MQYKNEHKLKCRFAECKQHRCPSNTRCWFYEFLVIHHCLDKRGGDSGVKCEYGVVNCLFVHFWFANPHLLHWSSGGEMFGGVEVVRKEKGFVVFPNARNGLGKPLASKLDTKCKNTTK